MLKRIKKVIQKLKKNNLDAILISKPANITYLIGFRDAEGELLITSEGQAIYFTNFLYKTEAEKINEWEVVISNGNIFNLIAEKIKKLKLKRIGFEAKNLSFLEFRTLKEKLSSELNFIETIDLIENLRAIKEPQEISFIRKSIEISKEAFEFISEIYNKNMSEKDLSIEIEKFLKLKGEIQLAFPPIVANKKNSSIVHHIPNDESLLGNFFLVDLGAKYKSYCADLTRVFILDKIPKFLKEIYDTIRFAHEEAIKVIKAGVSCKEVDLNARRIIEEKGWGKFFGHGIGHGVGLEVHELPYLNPKSQEVLEEGMVITIEPAVYIKDHFGIRLESMVLVKENKAEILSGTIF